MGASDITNNKFVRFTNKDMLTEEDRVQAVTSSSAIPVVFQSNTVGDRTFVDGGMMMQFDTNAGIQYCLNKGFDEKDIIIDAILCTDLKHTVKSKIP